MNLRLLSALVLLPSLAHAHPGHGAGDFGAGVVHPLPGWDHMLAMVAVGLWAAQLGGARRWMLPLGFVFAQGIGMTIGAAGPSPAWVDACIGLPVLTLGALIVARVRLLPKPAVAVTAGFALFHGIAHASEMPGSAGIPYTAGIFLTTALLHLGGLAAGNILVATDRGRWLQFAGAAVCAAALWHAAV